jgi:hypothetical protein
MYINTRDGEKARSNVTLYLRCTGVPPYALILYPRGVDHPPTSSAEVKGRVELYFYSPSGPLWPVLGWTLPFTVTVVIQLQYTARRAKLFLSHNEGIWRSMAPLILNLETSWEVNGQIHIQATLLPVRNRQEFKLAPEQVWMSLAPARSRTMILESQARSLVTTRTELPHFLYNFFDTITNKIHNIAIYNFTMKYLKMQSVSIP